MKSKWIRVIALLALLLMAVPVVSEKVRADGPFCIPTTGTVTDRFVPGGHGGVDIASGKSAGVTPVYAAYAGRVVYRGTMNCSTSVCYPLDVAVAINHGDIDGSGTYVLSHYHHMGHGSTSYVAVNVGDWVEQGDLIGYQGDYPEPATSGVHLHFAVAEMAKPFLNEYTSWGTRCVRSDLWYEFGGADCPVPNPEAAVGVNPESGTYLGSLPGYVSETCSQPSQSPPTKVSNIHPTSSGWYDHHTGDNTPSFAWTAATDPDGDLAGYYIAIDDPTPDGEYGNDWTIGTVTNWTVPSDSPISDGSHFVAITSRDSASHVNPPNTNNKGDAPYYDFVVDTKAPSNPSSVSSNCGADNNIWQKACNLPNFTWSGANDHGGVGINQYEYRWQTQGGSVIESDTTNRTSFTPQNSVSEGVYVLRLRTQDKLEHWSSWGDAFVLRYDNSDPTVSLQINGSAETTNQTNVLLSLSADDNLSGVADVRISNNNLAWSGWQPYAEAVPWTLPALDRHTHTVYVQVRDKAGNVSAIANDTITLDLYPPMPHSENYRICQDVVDAGGSADLASTSYALVSAIGQPWATGADANASPGFTERAGFLSGDTGCLPISYTVTSNYTITQWVIASAGNLRGSTSYRLGDTIGQSAASGGDAFASASYRLSSGFWAQIIGTVPPTSTLPTPVATITPTVTPTPTPTPTPQPGSFGISINNGDLYTNDPLVTVRAWAPNVTHLRLSNDSDYADEGWWTYQITNTWGISTHGDYVTPRYVYAWFRDKEGDVYGAYFDDIIYDPVAPEGQVSILGSEVATVTLWLEAWDDNSGMAEMRVGESPTLEGVSWQPYTDTVEWVLSDGVVYAQFRDNAGNLSPIYGTEPGAPPQTGDIYFPIILRQYP